MKFKKILSITQNLTKMKPQLSKKLVAFIVPLVGAIMFSMIAQYANAQKTNAEGPPRPGYFCRCGLPGYGCQGSSACLNRCKLACHRTSLADISSNSITQATGTSVFAVEPETQKKILQFKWKEWNQENAPTPANAIGRSDAKKYSLSN